MAHHQAALRIIPRHNSALRIDLDDPDAHYYVNTLAFLQRSRVQFALTINQLPAVLPLLRDFWTSARVDTTVNPHVIRAVVAGRHIAFSADDLRIFLELGTPEQEAGPQEFPTALRVGAFRRMGYAGDVYRSPYVKTFLQGNWRFLMHVLIQCLAARKTAFDGMNYRLQSLMISLVYNKPYSFSGYLFDECVAQTTAPMKDRFLLYPRFIMLLINTLHPDIPLDGESVRNPEITKRIYTDCLHTRGNRNAPYTPLFGAIMDANYVAPPNNGWEDVAVQGQGQVPPAQGNLPPQFNLPPPYPPFVVEHQQQQQQQQQQEQAEQQDLLHDVFQQLEQAVLPGQDPVDIAEAENIVHQVLHGEAPAQADSVAIDNFQSDPNAQVEDSFDLSVDISIAAAQGRDETRRYQRALQVSATRGKRQVDPEYFPSDEEDSTTALSRRRRPKAARTDAGPSSRPGIPTSSSPPVISTSAPPAVSMPIMLSTALPVISVPIVSTVPLVSSSPAVTIASVVPSAPLNLTVSAPLVNLLTGQIVVPLAATTVPPTVSPLAVTSRPLSPPITSSAATVPMGTNIDSPIGSPTPTVEVDSEYNFRVPSPVQQVDPIVLPLDTSLPEFDIPVQTTVSPTTTVPPATTLPPPPAESSTSLTEQVALLTTEVRTLTDKVQAHSSEISELKDLIRQLIAQGEKTSCNVDLLVRQRRDEADDDDAPPAREQPLTTTALVVYSGVRASEQRESTPAQEQGSGTGRQAVSGKGKQLRLDEDIFSGALDHLNLHVEFPGPTGLHDLNMDWTSSEQNFLNTITGDSTPSEVNKEQVVSDTVDIEVLHSQLLLPNVGEVGQDTTETDFNPSSKDIAKRCYFRKLIDPTKFKTRIDLTNAKTLKKGIMSWFYDSELDLFALKRFDGVQYLKRTFEALSSLPRLELQDLAKLELINPTRNGWVNEMERIIRAECRSRSFSHLKPLEGKLVKNKADINPSTKKPYFRMVYPEVAYEKIIPMKKFPQDILQDNFSFWFLDVATGEAVMEGYNEECLLRVYDPLHLANLSKADLKILSEHKMFVPEVFKDIASTYTRVVNVCVQKGMYAGCTHY